MQAIYLAGFDGVIVALILHAIQFRRYARLPHSGDAKVAGFLERMALSWDGVDDGPRLRAMRVANARLFVCGENFLFAFDEEISRQAPVLERLATV